MRCSVLDFSDADRSLMRDTNGTCISTEELCGSCVGGVDSKGESMKSSALFILGGFAATTMGLVWQTHMIFGLRNEVAELRKDLRTSLETVLDKPAGHLDSGQTGREKLELIKLRLQVR